VDGCTGVQRNAAPDDRAEDRRVQVDRGAWRIDGASGVLLQRNFVGDSRESARFYWDAISILRSS
jgi:hypothetical protein